MTCFFVGIFPRRVVEDVLNMMEFWDLNGWKKMIGLVSGPWQWRGKIVWCKYVMIGHFRKLLDRALVVYRRATLRLWKKNPKNIIPGRQEWTIRSLQIVQEVSINNDFSKNDASTFQHRRSLCCHCIFSGGKSVFKTNLSQLGSIGSEDTCFENNSFNPALPIDQSDNITIPIGSMRMVYLPTFLVDSAISQQLRGYEIALSAAKYAEAASRWVKISSEQIVHPQILVWNYQVWDCIYVFVVVFVDVLWIFVVSPIQLWRMFVKVFFGGAQSFGARNDEQKIQFPMEHAEVFGTLHTCYRVGAYPSTAPCLFSVVMVSLNFPCKNRGEDDTQFTR